MIGEMLAWIAAAITIRASRSAYIDYAFKHATKKDKSHYLRTNAKDVQTVHDDVAKAITGTQTQAIILGLGLILLAFMIRKTRGATASRWSFVLLSVLTQSPLLVV